MMKVRLRLRPPRAGEKMAKSKEAAKAQGFKRGLAGKNDAAGFTQGWNDNKESGAARTQGFIEGKRKRSKTRLEADKAAKDKKK
jgi:hypothetical protein